MIKKIILTAVLLFFLGYQAQSITVSDMEYKNHISSYFTEENNLKKQVNTSLRDIELRNGEFIVLSGNLSQNNKLVNYKVKALNISDEKANLIINKLNESKLTYNHVPDVYNPNIIYDQFNLYIGAKPQYELNKDFIVLISLTNQKLKQDKEKIMEEYAAVLESKVYPEFFKIKNEYGIPDDKRLSINLTIDKKGNLLNSEILSSINPTIDNYMLSAIKKLSPFGKLPDLYDSSVYKSVFQPGIDDLISIKVIKNALKVILTSDYDVIVKIMLNKRGDIVSSQVAKSSNNNLIDQEILNAINKTNFIELLQVAPEQKEFYLYITNSIQHKQFNITFQEINERNKLMPFDWQPYMIKFQEHIRKYWAPPKTNNSNSVTAYIVLNKDGQVINRSILKSSGDKSVDNAALKAIDESAPLPKFPKEYDKDVVSIQFTFDYNVYNYNYIKEYSYKDLCEGWTCKLLP